jgi:hypothetical protein
MATDHIRLQFAGHFRNSHNGSLLTVNVFKATGPADFVAFLYQCHLNEDNDGAPTAYGLDNPADPNGLQRNLQPLEGRPSQRSGLANATSPHQNFSAGSHNFAWVGVYSATPAFAQGHGLVIDNRPFLEARIAASGQAPVLPKQPGYFPVVQQAGAPAPGYYVSQANFVTDTTLPDWDQRKYVDASAVPYAVWANRWRSLGVNKGDFGLAIRNSTGAHGGFLFGDTGTTDRVGECSRKVVRTLSPNGYNEDHVSFLVFPGSGVGSAGAERLIKPRVKVEIAKLNYAANASIIGEHLSSSFSMNIMQALAAWGYHMTLKDI